MRKLRIHHEEFIQALAARLSIYLRVEFGLQMSQLHTVPFQKWCESIGSPSHLTMFRVDPLRGICLLDIPPRLGLTLVDRLLGGPGHSVTAQRDLSELEIALLDQVIQLIISEWCSQWSKYRDLRPNLIGHETNARFLQTSANDAVMLVLSVEAQIGDCLEPIQFAFPYSTIDPLVRLLSAKIDEGGSVEMTPEEAAPRAKPHLNALPLALEARWPGLHLSAREVASLRVGDVLPLPAGFASQIQISLGKTARFVGNLGSEDGRWAVQISGVATPPTAAPRK
jgi:flagellar motor switch protein FliM